MNYKGSSDPGIPSKGSMTPRLCANFLTGLYFTLISLILNSIGLFLIT